MKNCKKSIAFVDMLCVAQLDMFAIGKLDMTQRRLDMLAEPTRKKGI